MFCIFLRTNSDLCHLQHKLVGFYNRDEKCLQRGTDWVDRGSEGSPFGKILRNRSCPHRCVIRYSDSDIVTKLTVNGFYFYLLSSSVRYVQNVIQHFFHIRQNLSRIFSVRFVIFKSDIDYIFYIYQILEITGIQYKGRPAIYRL